MRTFLLCIWIITKLCFSVAISRLAVVVRIAVRSQYTLTLTETINTLMIIDTVSVVHALLASILLYYFAVSSLCACQSGTTLTRFEAGYTCIQPRITPMRLASKVIIITVHAIVDLWLARVVLVGAPLALLVTNAR